MGWKGQLRSFNAAVKRAEKLQLQKARLQAAASARMAAGRYEDYVQEIVSYHKSVSCSEIDWQGIANAPEPIEPTQTKEREAKAISKLTTYKPNFFIRILRLVNFRVNMLKRNIEKAKASDELQYQENLKTYQAAHSRWQNEKAFAERMLAGDTSAYSQVITERKPLDSIQMFSGQVGLSFESEKVMINIELDLDKNVPSETATYLKSGRLSIKDTPKTKFHALCQDHICSIALRVANEILALVPVDAVLVDVSTNILDTSIGTIEMKPILSLKVPRSTLKKINLSSVDPSDCMKNFIHNIDFKKTEGLRPVEKIA